MTLILEIKDDSNILIVEEFRTLLLVYCRSLCGHSIKIASLTNDFAIPSLAIPTDKDGSWFC